MYLSNQEGQEGVDGLNWICLIFIFGFSVYEPRKNREISFWGENTKKTPFL